MHRLRADASGFRAAVCVVTGGAGFIGSNLARALADAGAKVRVVDALVDGHGGDVRNLAGLDVDVVRADIGDPIVGDVLSDADIVFNVAGQVSHTDSMRDPLRDLALNTISHAAFLETVRHVDPTLRIVHTSTRQVYGRQAATPVDETCHARPVDVNGVAKWAGEQLHLVYHQAHGLPTTCLRLTNVYGPRQRLTSDVLGFLPVFFRRAMSNEPIVVFGDGSQRRDLLHVDDVGDVMLVAAGDEAVGEVFNVGAASDHALIDIARIITAAAGSCHEPRLVPWPDEHLAIDIGSFHTDGTKIAERLGWAATTDLADGVASTVAFVREHPWYLSST